MAVSFTFDDMQVGYLDLIEAICKQGRETAPRGMKTRELASPVIELTNPRHALATSINRGLNTKLVAAEAFQLVGGFSDPQMLVRAARNMAMFMDGGAFYGAYGPRLKSQLPEAVRQLTYDFDTRQAQITIWQQADLYVKTRDKPCTSLLQFLIRDDKLELHVTMRSNDIWWGVPYDVAAFCVLQCTVAHWLGLGLGSYFHRPVSLHAYERDFKNFEQLHGPLAPPQKLPFFKGYSWQWKQSERVEDFVANEMQRITDVAYNKHVPMTDEERWFHERLT